ncbi:MAG: M20/M25/M40 family metallo-hydrolase [Chlorobi bacterium]|nr:M20/M25/M40 family metallo-hydrolase [Chlorobiota bacterium]
MKKYSGILLTGIMGLIVFFSYRSQFPQTISDEKTPPAEFSTARALEKLKVISRSPHYAGNDAHDAVRIYLIDELKHLGLNVDTQEQVIFNRKWNSGVKANNIISVIEGENHSKGKSLLLLSHYDSRASASFGASDDGSGVVTILESIRAFLAKGQKPQNDIIILFSDAEELGLLGAKAFVKYHPLAKSVGLVINFEARGTGGPSFMLIETNGGNEQMIREFAKASPPFPVANSLLYSLYKLLPNDTDLTVFREDGDINGFNFAFIDRFYNYHMAMDNIENLDLRSLEHQGTYLTALLSYFSETDLSKLRSNNDDVYFNFPFAGMIYYPFSFIYPLWGLALLIFILFLISGLKTRVLKTRSLFISLAVYFSLIILIPVLTYFAWKIILILHPGYKDILHGFTYNGYYYIAAFSAFSLFVLFYVYSRFLKKHEAVNMLFASIFFWIIISLLTAIYLKGGSFFIIPVFFALLSAGLVMYGKNTAIRILLLLLLSVPVLVIFTPFVQVLTVGLGLKMSGLSMLFVVLIWGMTAVVITKPDQSRLLSYVFLLAGIGLMITASFKSDWSKERKRPDSLIYIADLDNNSAYIASFDRTTDEWTSKYLGKEPNRFNNSEKFVRGYFFRDLNLFSKTGLKNILPAKVETLKDTITGEKRNLKFEIKPTRRLNILQLLTPDDVTFHKLLINNYEVKPDAGKKSIFFAKGKSIKYFLQKGETLTIEMSFDKNTDPEFLLYEISFDLLNNPEFHISPRPEKYTQAPRINDAIVTVKTLKL